MSNTNLNYWFQDYKLIINLNELSLNSYLYIWMPVSFTKIDLVVCFQVSYKADDFKNNTI